MEYVGDPSTRLAALQKGEAQAIDRVPSDHVSTIAGDPALLMVTGQSTEYTYLLWKETSSEFTANKLIRQAVAHCIDNEGIVEGLMGGHAGVPDSIYSDAVWPFGAPAGASLPTYDLAAAAQKLEEAGYPNGEGLPEFNVVGVVGFYPNMKEYMEYITAQCAQVGIKMKLEIKEAAAWQDAYFGPEPTCDAAFIGWMNMSAEPDEFFLPFYRSGNTITHMNDPEIDALLTKDNTCKVLEDRAKIVREEIVPKLADLAITPPIVQTLNMNATLSQVKNYALLPNTVSCCGILTSRKPPPSFRRQPNNALPVCDNTCSVPRMPAGRSTESFIFIEEYSYVCFHTSSSWAGLDCDVLGRAPGISDCACAPRRSGADHCSEGTRG